jgi:hypothetical protein
MDLDGLTTRELLRLYADILTELLARGVVRSRNAPAGDLAEYLVAKAYGGVLGAPSEKSWDVLVGKRRLQVKVRLIAAGDRKSHSYSPFRSWEFDACVFVLLDAHTYDVTSAVEVPQAGVEGIARETKWVNGSRVGTRADLLGVPGAVDRTSEIRHALDELGSKSP